MLTCHGCSAAAWLVWSSSISASGSTHRPVEPVPVSQVPSGYFVAVIRAPPGTRKTTLSTHPWSRKTILSAIGTRTTILSQGAFQLPKLHAEGSSPFARSNTRLRAYGAVGERRCSGRAGVHGASMPRLDRGGDQRGGIRRSGGAVERELRCRLGVDTHRPEDHFGLAGSDMPVPTKDCALTCQVVCHAARGVLVGHCRSRGAHSNFHRGIGSSVLTSHCCGFRSQLTEEHTH